MKKQTIPIFIIGFMLATKISVVSAKDNEYISDVESSQDKSLIDRTAISGGTSIRYQSYAASGMTQVFGSNYSYTGRGCIGNVSVYSGFDNVLDLPDKSRVVSATFLVNDNDSTQQTRGILFTGGPDFTEIINVATSYVEVPGYTSIGGFLDFTIDNGLGNEKFASIRLELSGTSDPNPNASVCGVRIGYISPDVASDVIFASNFFR